MTRRFQHMRAEERVALAAMRLQGISLRAIGPPLGRSPGTLSRELSRNSTTDSTTGAYASRTTQAGCQARRASARPVRKLDPNGPAWPLVAHMLGWLWSPQHIVRTLRSMRPDRPELNVSHEIIHAHPKGELRKALIACLRQGRSARKPRSAGEDRRGQIPEIVSSHLRPPEVADRVMPGHWEGDLIKSTGNKSAIGVLVECTTRLVLLARMPDATAESAPATFTFKIKQITQPTRRTLAYD